MNEKPKNDSPRINPLSFFLLWVVLGAAMSLLGNTIFYWLSKWLLQILGDIAFTEYFPRFMLFAGLSLGIMLAPVEKILLKLRTGQWIKGWISSRIFSVFLSLTPYFLLQPFGLEHLVMNNPQNILQIVPIVLLSALPQVWILRRYVQNSWHYLFGVAISSMLPSLLISSMQNATLGAIFTIGASAAVMGLTILWLFSRPISAEKAKRSEAVSHERLEDTLPETEESQEERLEEAARKYEAL